MQAKYLISIMDLSASDIEEIFATARVLKEALSHGRRDMSLDGKTLGMILEKSSLRTRVSFEVAMNQLGGHAVYLGRHDIELGQREAVKDVAKTLSRYVDCIAIRTFAHTIVEEMARHATVPVINALSDYSHPCQALTDLYTIKEKLGNLKGIKLSFIGDGNNVARSLTMLCAKLGASFHIASPKGYQLSQEFVAKVRGLAPRDFTFLSADPHEVAEEADVLYTDTWVSMGQESEAEVRRKAFGGYQINSRVVGLAKKDALVMHCLPAHRGEEITDEVLDGSHSIVFDQAENRLHVQKAILKLLVGKKG